MSSINRKLADVLICIGYIILCTTFFLFFLMLAISIESGNIIIFIVGTIALILIGTLSIATGDMMKTIIKMRAELDQINKKQEHIEEDNV